MVISNFDKRLLIEQVRYIEAKQKLACDVADASAGLSEHSNFEERLWHRAEYQVKRYDLSGELGRAARLSRYAKTFALIVAVLLGVLGIVYAVTDSHTINIYWLLLVLLGFNLVSMLLWLIGIGLNMKGLIAGVLTRLTSWFPDYIDSKGSSSQQISVQADRAWLACHFSGAVGKWQFSKITHQLWLTYLLTGLIFLFLLLMVRQYDFVWGTTLLADTVFVKMTEILSAPLQVLGFATPSLDQVQDTRIGVAQVLNAEHRNHWAQFLLGALLCYGIVPRVLLWSLSALMCGRARRQFTLDLYLPYYITLRQQLMPLASHGQIIDADTSPVVISKTTAKTLSTTPLQHTLPDKAQWVAVELGDNISWPLQSIDTVYDLGQVVDRESLSSIVQQLQSKKRPVIAVAVSSVRSPDRGVQRTISSLMSDSEQRWLVLLQKNQDDALSATRLAAWYRLAEACQVPADHIISMSVV